MLGHGFGALAAPGDSKMADFRQRIWEIRVDSILKLDRAEKAGPEDQDHGSSSEEEPAF